MSINCAKCGKDLEKGECNCRVLTEEERKKLILKDIKNLKKKLLIKVTAVIKEKIVDGRDIAEIERKAEVRNIRAILNDKVKTFEVLGNADRILAGGDRNGRIHTILDNLLADFKVVWDLTDEDDWIKSVEADFEKIMKILVWGD